MIDTGYALKFVGGATGQYVSAAYTFPTTAFTVLFWYKATATFGTSEGWFGQAGSFFVGRQDVNDVQAYAYLNASGDFAGLRRLRVGRNLTHPSTDGVWHSRAYVVFVNGTNNGSISEYQDGVRLLTSVTDYTGDTDVPSGNLTYGCGQYGAQASGQFGVFNGTMDRVVIIDRQATVQEIQDYHTFYRIPTTPGALWEMNEGTSTVVGDSSGNGKTGNFAGTGTAPVWVGGVQHNRAQTPRVIRPHPFSPGIAR